jgi:hypothetical protein
MAEDDVILPQVQQAKDRIQTLYDWALTSSTVTSTLAAGSVTATTSLLMDQAMLTWTVSAPTARSYAHNVIVQLQASSSTE